MISNEVEFIEVYYGCADMDIYGVCWPTLAGEISSDIEPGECLVLGGHECPIIEYSNKQGASNE